MRDGDKSGVLSLSFILIWNSVPGFFHGILPDDLIYLLTTHMSQVSVWCCTAGSETAYFLFQIAFYHSCSKWFTILYLLNSSQLQHLWFSPAVHEKCILSGGKLIKFPVKYAGPLFKWCLKSGAGSGQRFNVVL